MPAKFNALNVFHARDDVIVAAIRDQAACHAWGRGDAVRAVLRVLYTRSRVRFWENTEGCFPSAQCTCGPSQPLHNTLTSSVPRQLDFLFLPGWAATARRAEPFCKREKWKKASLSWPSSGSGLKERPPIHFIVALCKFTQSDAF